MTSRDSGFDVLPDVFSPGEMQGVSAHLATPTLRRSRAGARNAGSDPVVAALARDNRLVRIARGVLGGDPFPYRATLFDKSKHSNWLVVWHQDTALPLRTRRDVPGWGPWSIKAGVLYAHAPAEALSRIVALRVHLDDSTAENGPLKVLPGTHHLGVLTDAQIKDSSRAIEPVACLVGAGGVVVIRPLLVHSSSKVSGPAPRRVVLHIEYATSRQLGDGLELQFADISEQLRPDRVASSTT
jgi:ectoine hydroxylase-related dioxygenase (phytanoyl-CoA dioxygenase family)